MKKASRIVAVLLLVLMNGKGWTTFGGLGTGANQFRFHDPSAGINFEVAGISVDSSNRTYVTDKSNGRIVRFDD